MRVTIIKEKYIPFVETYHFSHHRIPLIKFGSYLRIMQEFKLEFDPKNDFLI